MKTAVLFLVIFLCFSCNESRLSSITFVSRNGLSETISNKDRLKNYCKTDFLTSQPYQKVMRIYKRTPEGGAASILTSYHPNGQPRQYLETLNGQAHGAIREWHPNGQLKLESVVIAGIPDLSETAEESWLFDGDSSVWDSEGNLVAKYSYFKGFLEGETCYYNPLESIMYSGGKKHGPRSCYNTEEIYENDLLIEGKYYNNEGKKIFEVVSGNGFQAVFDNDKIKEILEIQNGRPEGQMKYFDKDQRLIREVCLHNGMKHGEEIIHNPKMSISWFEDNVQGVVKSWYPNGEPESKREMNMNQKHGISTAWYEDGGLMLIEEYENDSLIKGEYYRKGEKNAVSRVNKGEGEATLFNSLGHFLRKIQYHDGSPEQ